MSAPKLCAAARVREQIVSILESWGMDREIVRTTAEVMVETDLAGVDSHGISMLMDYENSKSKGKLNVKARPHVVKETPVTALVDADAGLGHPAAVMGMKLAIAKAKAMGVGVVSVFNSHHFGAAGYYAALASKEGLVGMVTSATRSIAVVPTRAAVPVLGHQPDRVRRARAAEPPVSARHGDVERRQQQDQGVRAERQAPAGGMGAGRAGQAHYRSGRRAGNRL
jgi:LDH2 family malate/lactate/ureidoglycolate dehydrogenase